MIAGRRGDADLAMAGFKRLPEVWRTHPE